MEQNSNDTPKISELVRQAYISNVTDSFLSALINEATFQIIVLIAAFLFICLQLPITYCLLSIPIVLLAIYILIYGSITMKAAQIMYEKKIEKCWVAEAYEPLFHSESPADSWYEILSEHQMIERNIKPEGRRKVRVTIQLAKIFNRCQNTEEFPNASYHLNESEFQKWYPYDPYHHKYSSCQINIGNTTESCSNFIFDHDVYGYTAVIEWELTCQKAHMIATGNSLFMVGVMLGSILFGEMSDRISQTPVDIGDFNPDNEGYGRKRIFFISLVTQVVFGIIAAFSPEFWTFTICRAVVGATTSGVFLVAYVIGLEMVGPSKRLIAGTVCHMFFSVGYMLTAVFAIYITDWRTLQLALTAPGILFMCYWWIIPESARWLLTKNKIAEAKKLILYAAKANNVTIEEATLDGLLASTEEKAALKDPNEKQATVFDIFRYPSLRKRSLIIFFDWFANNITYYGLSWNTNNLGGNPYLNFVISGAVEIPAYLFLILTLNRWGRKKIMCGCMILAGIALLITMAIPKDYQWLIITLAMIGKLSITASYGAVYIFSTEQFPTVIRNAGLGAGSTCARIGSVVAPYINILTHYWTPLPLLIFGVLAFIGGVMSLVLPETLNRKLPETIEEGEAFEKSCKENNTLNRVTVENNTPKKIIDGDVSATLLLSTKEDES